MFCTTFSHYFTTFVGVGAKVEAATDVARPVVIVNRVVLAGTKLGGAEEKIRRATERLRCEYRDLAGDNNKRCRRRRSLTLNFGVGVERLRD